MYEYLARVISETRTEARRHRIELSIGLELPDRDRAAIYGWPDRYVKEVKDAK